MLYIAKDMILGMKKLSNSKLLEVQFLILIITLIFYYMRQK